MLMDCDNVLDERIDPYELERLRDQYETQVRRGQPSHLAKFSFAHGLIKSTKDDVHQGIAILEQLLRENDRADIAMRDYIYYLAVGHARIKDYDRALAYIETLLHAEATNRQAITLREIIEKKMRNDGLLGAAILGGGGAILVGSLLALVFAGRK
ncbi:hypothetical protein PFISCL1PPCAC_22599 [Pristionchus fissidentatus]|uniref:Mitochondrial fission 1 protein n=1 Tax=Pristionchus fissidentatus TaxID=1538716 RepID=A0AAV5WNB4_9BILA|nr:hypothetical protein PFISCL1PPCAC_22599 [Pristionchus fissidentatus]